MARRTGNPGRQSGTRGADRAPARPARRAGAARGRAFLALLLCLAAAFVAGYLPDETLWEQYVRTPDTHPNIPNCSYSGYRYGEAPLPEPEVAVNVRDCGAKGDGVADDTHALQEAIRRAKDTGGGAVFNPAGVYRATDLLRLDRSGLVLRGEGPDRTVLVFERPLGDLLGPKKRWSWEGGLIWIEADRLQPVDADFPASRVAGPARQGEAAIEVDEPSASALAGLAGRPVQLRWEGDLTLAEHIFGHPAARSVKWEEWTQTASGRLIWSWPNEVVEVQGKRLILKKPLRLDVRPGWSVTIRPPGAHLRDVGVENLTVRMAPHEERGHLDDAGFNGIYLVGAMHCWIRNVTIEDADNGVILERSSHNTVRGLTVTGGACHHAATWRLFCHDNLMEDFAVRARVYHGISSQDLSSGNVWRRGVMEHGTLDSHCGMPFDSIRSDIRIVSCDGRGGGSSRAGPFVGRRMVAWNVAVTGPGRHRGAGLFGNPGQYSRGAIVGVRIAGPAERGSPDGAGDAIPGRGPWRMPPGGKGTAVECMGQAPDPPDLYEAELGLRLGAGR